MSYDSDPREESFNLEAEADNYLQLAANFTDGLYTITAYFANGVIKNYTQRLTGVFPEFLSIIYPSNGTTNVNPEDFIVRWQPIANSNVTDIALFISEIESKEELVEEFLQPNVTSFAVEPWLLRMNTEHRMELATIIFSEGGGIFNGYFNGSVKASVNISFFKTISSIIDKEGNMLVGFVRNRTGGGEFFVDVTGLQGSVGANLTIPSSRVYNMSYDHENLLDDYEFEVEADDYLALQNNFTDGNYVATVYFVDGDVRNYTQRLSGPFPAFMSITYPQNVSVVDPYNFTITWNPITDPLTNSLAFFIDEFESDESFFSAFTQPSLTRYTVPPGILRLGLVPYMLEYGTVIFSQGATFNNGVYNGSVKVSFDETMFLTTSSSRLEPRYRIEMKSDQGTASARVSGPGVPAYSVIRQLDRGRVSNLSFVPVDVGNFGSWIQIPTGAPLGTQVVSIHPAAFFAGQTGYFRLDFDLPSEFTNIHLVGRAVVDDVGRVFLNGQPLTPSMFSGSEYTVAEFDPQVFYTNNESMFRSGNNEILIADVNSDGLASAGSFYAIVRYDPPGLVIMTSSLQASVVGTFSSDRAEAIRGAPPYRWSIVSGVPPLGLDFHSDGVLNGTATEAGNFTFTVQVVDSNNTRVEKTLTKEVLVTMPSGELRLHAWGTTAVPGRVIDYFILVENVGRGPTDTLNSIVFVPIQPWLNINSINPPPRQVTSSSIFWDIPPLQPGNFHMLSYSARLQNTMPIGSIVKNTMCPFPPVPPRPLPAPQPLPLPIAIPAINRCNEQLNECLAQVPGSCAQSCLPPSSPADCSTCWSVAMHSCMLQFYACLNDVWSPGPYTPPTMSCEEEDQETRRPVDPNEKGVAANTFIKSDQLLLYPIHFENIGNAEAESIYVFDELSPTLDITTVQLTAPNGTVIPLQQGQSALLLWENKTRMFNITIGNRTITINRSYIEQWTASLNQRSLNWSLSNIYLEPNATDQVVFSVSTTSGLPNGTEIRNRAVIQFEIFEPITTNETLNIIDDVRPACWMNYLLPQTNELRFKIAWNGTDAVGEIDSYSVFVSENNGPLRSLVNSTIATNVTFAGYPGNTYGFTCIATDTAGNIEIQPPGGAEATTRIPDVILEVVGTSRIGTTVNLSVFGLGYEGKKYVLAMSLGNSPGIPLRDGRVIPLNPDIIFLLSIQAGQLIGLREYVNFINAQGQGTTYWDIPNVPELAGITVYAAFVIIDHTLPIPFAAISNSVQLMVI